MHLLGTQQVIDFFLTHVCSPLCLSMKDAFDLIHMYTRIHNYTYVHTCNPAHLPHTKHAHRHTHTKLCL